jgi:hypothetical protein
MPPRPALALAKPEARFLGSHSIEAMDVAACLPATRPAHHPRPIANMNQYLIRSF